MLSREARRKADFVVAIGLVGVGSAIIHHASTLPWATSRTGASAQWYLSPGLFPAIVGALLILFSLRVLATAVQEGGHRAVWSTFSVWLKALPANRPVQRVAFMMALIAAYIFLGVGTVDYRLASAVFLFLFITAFWLPDAGPRRLPRIAIALIVSIAAPFVAAYLFSTFLYVPMPG